MANLSIEVGYSMFPCDTRRTTPDTEAQDNQIETVHLVEGTSASLGHGEQQHLAAWQEAEREGLE